MSVISHLKLERFKLSETKEPHFLNEVIIRSTFTGTIKLRCTWWHYEDFQSWTYEFTVMLGIQVCLFFLRLHTLCPCNFTKSYRNLQVSMVFDKVIL